MEKTLVLSSLVLVAFVASTSHILPKADADDSGTFTEYNVMDYGAVGDGTRNDTQLVTSTFSLHPSSPFSGNSTISPRSPMSPVSRLPPPPPPPPPPATMSPASAPSSPSNSTAQGPDVSTGTTNSSAVSEPGGSDSSNSSEIVDSGASSNNTDNSNSTSVDSPPDNSTSSTSNSTIDTSEDSSNSTVISETGDLNTTSNSSSTATRMTEFSVLKYGAVGDGATNDTQCPDLNNQPDVQVTGSVAEAFADAWKAACAVNYAYVHAPLGYKFLVYPITFKGPCLLNMTFKVDGTVLAPPETSVWNVTSGKDHWLEFSKVSMIVQGTGTINGQGQNWWAESCKTNSSNACKDGPTAVVFDTCTNVTVKYVTILNSQQMHLAFEKSVGIMVNSINISAPGDSPNTDGIHLQNASSVTIKNSFIGTGDDCVSIQNGSSSVTIKNITCGPGHGISVGGLGKKNTSATVSNIVVEDVVFTNSTNGVRIKSWQGSSGTASTFTYQNLVMNNVKNPILIDQYYCDSASSGSCPNFTSNVQISGITYKNITGTSATKIAVKLACSETVACTGITLQDIDIVQTSGSAATSSCADAYGVTANTVIPSSCLLTSS